MQISGRISAAIEILTDFDTRRVPLKTAIADWGRNNRYAGAKDRAWISGLCLDVLRRSRSLAHVAGTEGARGRVLAALRFMWGMERNELSDVVAEEPHGPGPLTQEEQTMLAGEITAHDWQMDVPDWVMPMLERALGDQARAEAAALAMRADVDLRLNTLKATPEKSLQALKSVKGKAIPILTTAARITAPDPSEKAPAVTVIPAFNKGWLEVQDLGSQIAATASGEIKGKQVLDFCAGGGGKTLALAALMDNTGQLHAYDIDARRLKPLYARAKRAGLRNLQILPPDHRNEPTEETLRALINKMDVVFVDAPCTGAGTWRRHPDTKWRLTEQQLQRRMDEQDQVLRTAASFVKPGGHLVYVTCSLFMEENEDRLAAFCESHPDFSRQAVLPAIEASGLLTAEGKDALSKRTLDDGALRLTPARSGTDGFYVARLARAS